MKVHPPRPYYYGQYRYDNYLLDATDEIERNTSVHRQGTQLQKQTLEVMREQADESRRNTEELAEVRGELRGIRGGLQGMGDEVRLGFSLVVDRMDQQIKLFSQAVAQLDEIRRTLKTPRATEATELFNQAEYCFQEGLYDEALEFLLKGDEGYIRHEGKTLHPPRMSINQLEIKIDARLCVRGRCACVRTPLEGVVCCVCVCVWRRVWRRVWRHRDRLAPSRQYEQGVPGSSSRKSGNTGSGREVAGRKWGS